MGSVTVTFTSVNSVSVFRTLSDRVACGSDRGGELGPGETSCATAKMGRESERIKPRPAQPTFIALLQQHNGAARFVRINKAPGPLDLYCILNKECITPRVKATGSRYRRKQQGPA